MLAIKPACSLVQEAHCLELLEAVQARDPVVGFLSSGQSRDKLGISQAQEQPRVQESLPWLEVTPAHDPVRDFFFPGA